MTPEENAQENVNTETIEIENVVQAPEEPEKGLSVREALEVAHTALDHKEETPAPAPAAEQKVSQEPTYQPPAEYTKEEKEDFLGLSKRQQEASLRLYQSSRKRFDEIREESRRAKEAQEEYRSIKELSSSLEPYLKVMGVKERSDVALQKAVALWKDFEYAEDPKKAAAQYLMAKGVQPPEDWLGGKTTNISDEQIRPLREELAEVKNILAQEQKAKVEAQILAEFGSFESAKNAAGSHKYPDLHSPSGTLLAAKVGQLVNGITPLSKEFIQDVHSRIPNATYQTLIEEAYKMRGGRVDLSEVPSQPAQNHLTKAKRASSSKPGSSRGVSINGSSNKKLPLGEALRSAWHDLSEN